MFNLNSKAMLEYQKMILDKVSFDRKLFEKEFYKSFKWLNEEESNLLKHWAYKKYGHLFAEVFDNIVDHTAA